MRIILVFILLLLHLLAAPHSAVGDGSQADEWLGIGGLRIVDAHHTEGYLLGMMNLSAQSRRVWTVPALPARPPSEVAGIWYFNLEGEGRREVDLTLYQVGGEVFGEGTMTSEMRRWPVTAAGYVSPNELELSLVTVGDPALIRVRLSLLTTPARGSYAAYAPSGHAGSGDAFGYKRGPLGGIFGPAPASSILPPDGSWRPGAVTGPA